MKATIKAGRWLLAALAAAAVLLTGCGGGGNSKPTTAPSAPTGVIATPGSGQVTVSWKAVSGATSYNIYYATTSGVTAATGIAVKDATSPAVVPNLTNGTTYYFIVTAVNSVGESAASTEVSAVPATNPAPAAPSGVQASAADGQVKLTWTAVTGATSYNVYYSTSSPVNTTGTPDNATTNSATVSALTNGTTYYFVVTAVNANGESTTSTEVSAMPQVTPPPAAPSGVQASAGDSQVTLTWTAVTGATSYNVYYGTSAQVTIATGTQVANVKSGDSIGNLTNGTAYYFIVTALNANGESTASTVVSATPSTAPFIQATVLGLANSNDASYFNNNLEQVEVCSDATCNTPITDATVTVNGTALTYDSNKNQYQGSVAIAAGATVSLSVTVNGTVYTASGKAFTTYPSITAPAANASWAADSTNDITWSAGAPTSGATYAVGILDTNSGEFVYPAGGNGPKDVGISASSETINANSLSAGSYYVLVGIGTAGITDESSGGGISIANTASGSGLWIAGIGDLVPITVTGGTAPTAPTNVSASAGDGQVTLTWNAVSGATSYNVYYGTSNTLTTSNGTEITGVSSGDIINNLQNGTTYYFIVTAANSIGESGASSMVSATPASSVQTPTAPTGVTPTAGDSQVTLSWSAVSGATSYNVYYSTNSNVTPGSGATEIPNASNPVIVNNLTNGTPYYFVVTAVNSAGESGASTVVTATPTNVPAAAPYIAATVLTVPGTSPIPWSAQVSVCSDGSQCLTPITTGVTVTVNGTALTYASHDEAYEGTVVVGAGGSVSVSVSVGGTTYTASGTQFNSPPSITAPTTGTTWTAASANDITWSGGSTSGADYVVGLMDSSSGDFVFPSGNHGPEEVATTTTSAQVPANTLTAGSTYAVLVGVATPGVGNHPMSGGHAFSNNPASGSGLWIGYLASFQYVTAQ